MSNLALFRNAFCTCLLFSLGLPGFYGQLAEAQAQPAIFPVPAQISIPAGSTPFFTGDVDGDGTPDLAYTLLANPGLATTLGIVLNISSNAPTTVTTALCPQGASLPAFADVNNDKKLDLVYSCGGLYLTIQLGNGDGSFQGPTYVAANVGSPLVVDLNGDGYPDIVTGVFSQQSTSSQLAVFLNQGSSAPGTFGTPKQYPIPNPSNGLAVGDFNGDGKLDLLTATYTSLPNLTGIAVLYGNGDGTLNPAKTQSTATFSSFTVGDFNGDGVTDVASMLLASPDGLYGTVQVLLGSTSETFTQGASLPVVATNSTVTGYGGPLEAVTLSSAGDVDLVVVTNVLNFFRGDGKGNFTPAGSYGLGSILFADVNGDGNQDLLLGYTSQVLVFPGNGDGTFRAPPATAVYGSVADINNDGIADMVFLPPLGGNFFAAALGRGDGSFAILDQPVPLAASSGYSLMLADLNGDGKVDVLAIQAGTIKPGLCFGPNDAQLLSFLGNGNGQFQPKGTGLALGVFDPTAGISGDFNSDGKLDLILPGFISGCEAGLLFVPGNGDGTFATPVILDASQSLEYPSLLVGDLNNDKKLDFIWGNAVFLGNGDGTFKQIPLNIPIDPVANPAPLALADLNGDGILDLMSNPGNSLYAGNGDGTFQTTPFFAQTQLVNPSLAIGNVNGDGDPDLIFAGDPVNSDNLYLMPYLGDGHGNFTQDTNNYPVSLLQSASTAAVLTRLNNQAPMLPNDNSLDALVAVSLGGSVYTASLLNQTNPAPGKPALIPSTTTLQSSVTTAAPGGAITLTASVFGTNPTGLVSFVADGSSLGTAVLAGGTATLQTSFANAGSFTVTASYPGDSSNASSSSAPINITVAQARSATALQASPSAASVNGKVALTATVSGFSPTGSVFFAAGSTSLGTATLTNGTATLQSSFASAGSYAIIATYQGDKNNSASTSNAVTVVVAAPDFTIAATPTSGSITPGQSATFTFTVSPIGGYAGTVQFSCSTLPSHASCAFSPASVTPTSGSPASSTLTVTTAAAVALFRPDRPLVKSMIPVDGLALAGLMGLVFTPGKNMRWSRSLRMLVAGLSLAAAAFLLIACGGGGSSSPSSPGTPAGSYTISVNASGNAGGPQHGVNIVLSVQ